MNHSDEYENLSALVDGELAGDQLRFMLRRMDGHAQLRSSWSRYHLIGDGVRGELPMLADDDFAACVMQRINAPEILGETTTRSRRHPHRWLRWSAGGAIAAGVAVAALVVTQPQMQDGPTTASISGSSTTATLAAVAPSAQEAASGSTMNAPAVPRWLQAQPSAARLASPAAANFSSLGQWMRMNEQSSGYYERNLAPYALSPRTRHLHRSSADDGYRLLPASPPREAPSERPLRMQVP